MDVCVCRMNAFDCSNDFQFTLVHPGNAALNFRPAQIDLNVDRCEMSFANIFFFLDRSMRFYFIFLLRQSSFPHSAPLVLCETRELSKHDPHAPKKNPNWVNAFNVKHYSITIMTSSSTYNDNSNATAARSPALKTFGNRKKRIHSD